LAQNLAAQAVTDLAEGGSLGIRELQSTFQLGLQDAVFGGQIFVPRQQRRSTSVAAMFSSSPRSERPTMRPTWA
jgi:hypothetical protein